MGRYRAVLRARGTSFILTAEAREPITYRFKMGGQPSFNPILINDALDRKIVAFRQQIGRPSQWELELDGPDGSITIEGLWLLGRGRAVGPNRVRYVLADKRYALMRTMYDTWFNKLRVANDFNNPSGARVDPNVSILGRVSKFHFIANTCRDSTKGQASIPNPVFSSGAGFNDVNEWDPWSSYQALRYSVSDDGFLKDKAMDIRNPDGTLFQFGNVILSSRNVERKVLLKNWNPRKHWPLAIDELEVLARIGLYVNEKAEFVLEDLEPDNSIFQGFGTYQGAGGIPIAADLGWDAPYDSVIRHKTYHEIRWDYDEQVAEQQARLKNTYGSFAGTIDGSRVTRPSSGFRRTPLAFPPNPRTTFKIKNVLPLPQPIPARGLKAGQWVEVFEALDAWEQQGKATPNLLPKATAIFKNSPWLIYEPAAVRRYILTSGLAHLWIRDYTAPNKRFPILEARVASIYQHFRRTFQIPEEWLDHIEDIRADVGTVFAGVSRTREPSPVKLDYWSVDSTLYRHSKGTSDNKQRGQGHLRNVEIDGKGLYEQFKFDPVSAIKSPFNFLYNGVQSNSFGVNIVNPGSVYDSVFDDFPSSPARVSLIDPARGVFQVNFLPDLTGAVSKFNPGILNPRTMPTTNIGALPGSVLMGFARLLPVFRLATVLSIRFKSPNNTNRHVSFFASKSNNFQVPPRSTGPIMEVMSRGFAAYKTYEHKKVEWLESAGKLVLRHRGAVANFDALQEFSESMFEQIYFKFAPRVLGEYSRVGWRGEMPIGHVREVRVSLGRNGAFETTLNGSRMPSLPGLFEGLSSDTRNLVQGFELGTRTDIE